MISHERRLLDTMQRIFELTPSALEEYGGNYTHYAEQKAFQLSALQSEEKQLQSQLNREKTELQRTLEKKAQRRRQGESPFIRLLLCPAAGYEKEQSGEAAIKNNRPS